MRLDGSIGSLSIADKLLRNIDQEGEADGYTTNQSRKHAHVPLYLVPRA